MSQQQAVDAAAPAIEMAPLSRRLMAAVVDGADRGAFLVAVVASATQLDQMPTPRFVAFGAAVVLVALAGLYQALFLLWAEATPGMKYARVGLRTFENQFPTRTQRCRRLGALALSVLPLGLGLMWAIFDEDQLSWHDRFSRTYQRVCTE